MTNTRHLIFLVLTQFMLCVFLSGAAMGASKTPVADTQDSVLLGFSTRYATIDLEAGRFRIDRTLLQNKKEKLKTGKLIRFTVSYGNERFPEGIVTSLSVMEGPVTTCPTVCL